MKIKLLLILCGWFALFCQGVVIAYYWRWIVMPIFHVKEISIPMSAGLAQLWQVFNTKISLNEFTNEYTADDCKNVLSSALSITLVELGIGYVISLLIYG